MTHPLTPREKVARILFERGRGAHDAASWTEAGNEMQDWLLGHADAILTALASGSGDHAELARLAEAATHKIWSAFTDDSASRPHTNLVSFDPVTDFVLSIPGAHKNDPNVAFIAAANPATVLALLAEIAALNDYGRSVAKEALAYRNQATEAERKLAEAVSVMDQIREAASISKARDLARTFLSKEAERG